MSLAALDQDHFFEFARAMYGATLTIDYLLAARLVSCFVAQLSLFVH